jgi:hypothetical protein
VGRYDAHEFARTDDFCSLPKSWEMAGVSGNEIVCAGGICALKEYIVVRVDCDLKTPPGNNRPSASPDELQYLLSDPSADLKFWAGQQSRYSVNIEDEM